MIIIVTKHTPECTKLHYIKKYSPGSILPNPLNLTPTSLLLLNYYYNLFLGYKLQRYKNMNTAHGAGCGKWVFGIPNSASPLFSKIWA